MSSLIELILDNNVVASSTDITESNIVPNGKNVLVRRFGGFSKDGLVALQWGSAGSWQTIRASGNSFEFIIDKEFLGDGVKKFRIVRQNFLSSSASIVSWVEAIIVD